MKKTLKDKKSQAILNAATSMFLEYGYRSVSMDKIAQAAPVSKATLYNHFESKEVLLAGVIRSLCDELLKTMSQAHSENETLEQTLTQIANSFVDLVFSENAIAIYRLIIAESRDFPELSQLFYRSGPQIALNQFQQYWRKLQEHGVLQQIDPVFSADAFFSLLKGEIHLQCLLGIRELPSDEEKKQMVKHVIDFYIQGINHAT